MTAALAENAKDMVRFLVATNTSIRCFGKDPFDNKQAALTVMKKQRRHSTKHRLVVYTCIECGKYHIGSSLQKSKGKPCKKN